VYGIKLNGVGNNILREEKDISLESKFNKRNEDFNFKFHGRFDISSIKNIVSSFDVEWNLDTYRQEDYSVHENTMSYPVYDHPHFWIFGDPYQLSIKSNNHNLISELEPIIKTLELIHNGKVGKTLLIKLPPTKDVHKHTDKGDYLGIIRRHHIPIITNENVKFYVGDEFKQMREGECWEINNSLMHSVENNGKTDRVHLMFDILPQEYIV
jgi:hypothetical protein